MNQQEIKQRQKRLRKKADEIEYFCNKYENKKLYKSLTIKKL